MSILFFRPKTIVFGASFVGLVVLTGCGLMERLEDSGRDESEATESATEPMAAEQTPLEDETQVAISDERETPEEPTRSDSPEPPAPAATRQTPRAPSPATEPLSKPAEPAPVESTRARTEPEMPASAEEPVANSELTLPEPVEPKTDIPMPVEPPPPMEPEIVEVEIAEGTIFELELLTALDSSVNQVGDEIQARTISPVYVRGEEVLREGSYLEGRVTEVAASGRVRGRAALAFTFERLSTRTGVVTIRTSYVAEQADAGTKDDAKKIGGAAGVGAIIGGIIGGKKGAAVGATIGGAGGTGVVLSTKGEEVRMRVGSQFNVRLDEPVIITLN